MGMVSHVVSRIAQDPDTPHLPYYIFRTLMRMFLAYCLVAVFGLAYGIIAGLYPGPRRVMLPLLDIMQSIPILGYLPAAILFFVSAFPGQTGQEMASIVLIFTGMAWAVAFSVYGATRQISKDLKEAGSMFGLRGWKYVRRIVLPAVFPAFITGSMLAMGGGWYFLTAAEYLSFGSKVIKLDGIGFYLANAVYERHNFPAAILGLVVFALVVYSINRIIWRPLIYYSRRFSFQNVGLERDPKQEKAPLLQALQETAAIRSSVEKKMAFATKPLGEELHRLLPAVETTESIAKSSFTKYRKAINLGIYLVLFALVMWLSALFVSASLQKPISDLETSFAAHPEAAQLPLYALFSLARIFIAYAIALSWTLVAAIVIMRSKKLQDIFIPVFDVAQSIPAIALLPFIILIVLSFVGGGLGIELVTILLILTGTQWYLMFNIIGAIRSIPGDIVEASESFGIRGFKYVRTVLLPAIFPGIVLGSIQAFGGAWNALIVSEYFVYQKCAGGICKAHGLGSFLTTATSEWGDTGMVIIAVAIMSVTIIILNNLVWKKLFAKAERYRFENT